MERPIEDKKLENATEMLAESIEQEMDNTETTISRLKKILNVQRCIIIFLLAVIVILLLKGCSNPEADIEAVDTTPISSGVSNITTQEAVETTEPAVEVTESAVESADEELQEYIVTKENYSTFPDSPDKDLFVNDIWNNQKYLYDSVLFCQDDVDPLLLGYGDLGFGNLELASKSYIDKTDDWYANNNTMYMKCGTDLSSVNDNTLVYRINAKLFMDFFEADSYWIGVRNDEGYYEDDWTNLASMYAGTEKLGMCLQCFSADEGYLNYYYDDIKDIVSDFEISDNKYIEISLPYVEVAKDSILSFALVE